MTSLPCALNGNAWPCQRLCSGGVQGRYRTARTAGSWDLPCKPHAWICCMLRATCCVGTNDASVGVIVTQVSPTHPNILPNCPIFLVPSNPQPPFLFYKTLSLVSAVTALMRLWAIWRWSWYFIDLTWPVDERCWTTGQTRAAGWEKKTKTGEMTGRQ